MRIIQQRLGVSIPANAELPLQALSPSVMAMITTYVIYASAQLIDPHISYYLSPVSSLYSPFYSAVKVIIQAHRHQISYLILGIFLF